MSTTAVRPALHTLDVVAANGVPFRVLAIPAGTVGPNRHRAPGTQPGALVEFYDRRYEHTEHGQFVAYYGQREIERPGGLSLSGRSDEWSVDAGTMRLIGGWLTHLRDSGALARP